MKPKIAATILALLSAAFLWQSFAQTLSPETPCQAACTAKWDACIKANSKPGAHPGIATALCTTPYVDCLDECKFAQLGTPKTPCQAACKMKFETCLKQKTGTCGVEYDLCVLECKQRTNFRARSPIASNELIIAAVGIFRFVPELGRKFRVTGVNPRNIARQYWPVTAVPHRNREGENFERPVKCRAVERPRPRTMP